MKISELFDLSQGNSFELMNMSENLNSNINFVARTANNNGVVAKVNKIDKTEPFPAGTITVALGGSVLSTFVHMKPFYTGFHMMVLTPKTEMTMQEKLFYCMCIKENAYRYTYGRQANKTLKDIELPNIPDWVYTTPIDYEKIKTKIVEKQLDLKIDSWKIFQLKELFNICGTKTTKLEYLSKIGIGQYPYITTQAVSNAVSGFYNYYTETGNVLVVDSAVTGHCTYQENNFSASDHVEKLLPHFKINKYIGLFLSAIINQDKHRYNYGRKFNQQKIKNTIIKLPATKLGEPDWKFMENYIKALPYSDKI